jgi:methyl-accepting chemotaxis protein
MTITPPAQTSVAAAEQAKALLAYAADGRHFYNPYYDETHVILQERDAATAMYVAQAATANAMLAVAGELAELRAELRQATAIRSDLADIATAVRGLAGSLVTSAAQTADVARAVRELNTTLAEHMDEQADQVEAVRDAVEEGLADVANVIDVVELLVRPRGGWWSRLLWWRRRSAAQVAAELIASAGKDGLVDEAPVCELPPQREGGAA